MGTMLRTTLIESFSIDQIDILKFSQTQRSQYEALGNKYRVCDVYSLECCAEVYCVRLNYKQTWATASSYVNDQVSNDFCAAFELSHGCYWINGFSVTNYTAKKDQNNKIYSISNWVAEHSIEAEALTVFPIKTWTQDKISGMFCYQP